MKEWQLNAGEKVCACVWVQVCASAHFGPPHSTADALTTGSGWKPTGSTLRVFCSTASKMAEPSWKRGEERRALTDAGGIRIFLIHVNMRLQGTQSGPGFSLGFSKPCTFVNWTFLKNQTKRVPRQTGWSLFQLAEGEHGARLARSPPTHAQIFLLWGDSVPKKADARTFNKHFAALSTET